MGLTFVKNNFDFISHQQDKVNVAESTLTVMTNIFVVMATCTATFKGTSVVVPRHTTPPRMRVVEGIFTQKASLAARAWSIQHQGCSLERVNAVEGLGTTRNDKFAVQSVYFQEQEER